MSYMKNHMIDELLDEALRHLGRTDHRDDCPRLRDDYECTCGLSDVKAGIEEYLKSTDDELNRAAWEVDRALRYLQQLIAERERKHAEQAGAAADREIEAGRKPF